MPDDNRISGELQTQLMTALWRLGAGARPGVPRRPTPAASRGGAVVARASPLRRSTAFQDFAPEDLRYIASFKSQHRFSLAHSDLILDGETFCAEPGYPIHLAPAQPLSFVKLAA